MKSSPFDHRRNRQIGDGLRSALSGPDEAEFIRRVVDAAEGILDRRTDSDDSWEILSAWARPGLAAAAIGTILAAVFWWHGSQDPPDAATALADPLQAASEIPAEFLASQAPDLGEILSLELGN